MLEMSWAETLGTCWVALKAALLVATMADQWAGRLVCQTAAHWAVSSDARTVDLRAGLRAGL